MSDTPITRARAAAKSLRDTFEANKALEWEILSRDALSAVDAAVWAAKDAGLSISEIARQYGTKDRGTIYAILDRRDAVLATAPRTVKVAPLVDTPYPDAYRVTLPTETTDLYVRNGNLLIIDCPPNSVVRSAVNGDPNHKSLLDKIKKEVGL